LTYKPMLKETGVTMHKSRKYKSPKNLFSHPFPLQGRGWVACLQVAHP